jgi:hypothetical protein
MTFTLKSVVLLGLAMSIVLAAIVVSFVWAAVSQRGTTSYEGYYSPVYAPDGQYVYFMERDTDGIVTLMRPGDLFFTPPKYDVQVMKDTFILKRLHVANGRIEELRRLSPSPIEGRRYEQIGNPFPLPGVRLRFKEDGQLEFRVCLTTREGSNSREHFASGTWVGSGDAAEITDDWKNAACMISGYDEWPLFGDYELQEVRGRQYFPVAIIAYNHKTRDVRALVKNKDYDNAYPNGVPLEKIVENSRREGMERDQTVRRVYKELVAKYRATGMLDNDALLRAGKDMQKLGYFPKSTMIVARRLNRAAARNVEKAALFSIAKGEMESGIFQDIEKAIASPGEEIDKGDEYHTHRDYSTSERLNKFIKSGKTRFYVEYLGETYELTIKRP